MSQNALADETSPYLLQHADNPVNWYPWSDEALQLARQQNKPILLSIGYSACHWCHVMAHESFEDETTASLMNEFFINIKVDREERPDIDRIYQTAQHLLTRRTGGWPLTMFLTPDDHMPFFGGTYFPRESRYGLPGFKDLLRHIHTAYQDNPQSIREQNQSLIQSLQNIEPPSGNDSVMLHRGPLQTAIMQFQNAFNQRSGGFGGAPKFPQPTNLEFLLKYSANQIEPLTARDEARGMALFTLEKMARGGIYDHIGGGFSRYSVDDEWMIPHFEKMLYDNGPLLGLCTSAWQLTGDKLFKDTVMETAQWVMREMQSPQGGYYSSLDADSEGEEGKFYVWDKEEIKKRLPTEEFDVFAFHYGLNNRANFENRWHLYELDSLTETAQRFSLSGEDCAARLQSAANRLFSIREYRIRPARDDKVLTSWNALMIRGMAEAARVFNEKAFADSATAALDFIRNSLWQDERLLATCKAGKAHLNAYLDDHAFLIEAILSQLQVRWNSKQLQFAMQLAESLLQRFGADDNMGFFFTSHDHEKLIQRNKPYVDETLPAGNGVAARALNILGHLISEPRYIDAAENTLKSAWTGLEQMPYAHGTLLCALLDQLSAPELVILRGPMDEMSHWQQQINKSGFHPNRYMFAIPESEPDLPGILADTGDSDTIRARICLADRCLPPVFDLQSLLDGLKTGKPG